jgi:hypothetical protein
MPKNGIGGFFPECFREDNDMPIFFCQNRVLANRKLLKSLQCQMPIYATLKGEKKLAHLFANSFTLDFRAILVLGDENCRRKGTTMLTVYAPEEKERPCPDVEFDRCNLALKVRQDKRSYEIDLERCNDPAQILGWIFQLNGKPWMTHDLMGQVVKALDDACYEVFGQGIQGVFCPFGASKQAKWTRKSKKHVLPDCPEFRKKRGRHAANEGGPF